MPPPDCLLSPGLDEDFCPLPDEPDCCLSSFFVLDRILFSVLNVLYVIDRACYSRLAGAVRAAKEIVIRLDTVTDDLAAALRADRRKFVDRTFETIERVPVPGGYNFERQIIIVAADLAACHNNLLIRSELIQRNKP